MRNQASLTLTRGKNRTFTDHLKRSLISPRQMSTSVAFCVLWRHIYLGFGFYRWQLRCGLRVDIWATKEWMVSIFKVKHSKTLVLFSIFLSASIATVLLKAKTYGQKKRKIWKKVCHVGWRHRVSAAKFAYESHNINNILWTTQGYLLKVKTFQNIAM